MTTEEFVVRAKIAVAECNNTDVRAVDADIIMIDDVHIVWFAYTLGNMKCLCKTALPDEMYYEVTYNKGKDEIYLDVYHKFCNTIVRTLGVLR